MDIVASSSRPLAIGAAALVSAILVLRKGWRAEQEREDNAGRERAVRKDRSNRWNDIYTRKGKQGLANNDTPLHVLGGYDMFTLEQWVGQVNMLCGPDSGPQCDLALREGHRVLEVGVGGGAFVDALNRIAGGKLQLYGVDYAQSLIDCIKQRIPEGKFALADACDLGSTVPWLREGHAEKEADFDCVVSFGVTQYLNDLKDLGKMVCEMARVARSGARLLVAEVSDLGKKALADKMRGKTHNQVKKVSSDAPTHLYIPKSFWRDIADAAGVELICVKDHTDIGLSYPTAAYRYSVWMNKL